MSEDSDLLRELVAEVAAAYFANSHVAPTDIPQVISQIATSLGSIAASAAQAEPVAEEPPSAVRLTAAQVRKSITADALISFEDGKRYKTLKRHLSTHGLTPAQYVEKWGLPRDYPMTSASYSAARSAMAVSFGLGQKGRKAKASPALRKARSKV